LSEAGAAAGPRVGVGAVVVHEGRVVLIRRGKEPMYGRWIVPGGTVELGETLEEACVRELREETGLDVRPLELLTVFDRIDRHGDDVRYHYVIVDYLCSWQGGELQAGSDALEAAWASRDELKDYDLPPKALEVILDGLGRAGQRAG
jgi:mutator protein MutT